MHTHEPEGVEDIVWMHTEWRMHGFPTEEDQKDSWLHVGTEREENEVGNQLAMRRNADGVDPTGTAVAQPERNRCNGKVHTLTETTTGSN